MRRFVLFVCALAFVTAVAVAQAPEPKVGPELAKLNTTLTQVVALLKEYTATQRLDLLLKRMELEAGRRDEAEKQLKAAETERGDLQATLGETELRLSTFAEEARHPDSKIPADELERAAAQVEEQLRQVKARLAQLGPEIAALKARIDEHADAEGQWRALLDKRLAAQ